MQDLLTIAAAATAVFTVGYTVVAFAAYAWNRAGADLRRTTATPVAPAPQPEPAPIVAAPTPAPVAPSPAGDAIRAVAAQLRQERQTQIAATAGLLAAAAQIAENHDRLIAEVVEVAEADLEPPLTSLGIRELRQRCKTAGLKGTSRWTKAQCLAALEPPTSAAEPAPEPRLRRRRAAA